MTGFRNAMMGAAGAAGAGGYAVDNSAIFNNPDSEYLAADSGFGTPSNADIGTISFWFKRGNLDGSNLRLFTHGSGGSVQIQAYLLSANTLAVGNGTEVTTTQVFRDPHAWYHLVIRVDTSQGTDADRVRLYLNGSQITSFSASSYPSQNGDVFTSTGWRIAAYSGGTGNNFDGYMSEVIYCDGQSLGPTSFGETDNNGVWRPINVSGLTFGNNGFYLNMAASGSDLGDDASGNSNDFTNTNSVTQSNDSPTNNHITWTKLKPTTVTTSQGNTHVDTGGTTRNISGSIGLTTGKWYWEIKVTSNVAGFGAGLAKESASTSSSPFSANMYAIAASDGTFYNEGSGGTSGTGLSTNDIMGLAYDADAGKIWIAKNNTWMNSGDPAGGSGEMSSSIPTTEAMFPITGTANVTMTAEAEFGATTFTYTPPTGFNAINTTNLFAASAPAIEDGSAYMQSSLWSGNSSSQTVSQSGNSTFTSDWVWIKDRNFGNGGNVFDSVRGSSKGLATFDDGTEDTNTDGVTFGAGTIAFTGAGNTGDINNSGRTYVGWQWLAGNGTVSNSDGSLSSTVSANQTAGFSIVSYTGNGGDGGAQTVGHGLSGKTPKMILIKNRSATNNWVVYHFDVGLNAITLNTDAARITTGASVYWNDTHPTSSVFTVNTNAGVNGNTNSMIAYCFADVPGYSRFGYYIGNASSDGPFVELGFRPAFVMIKAITQVESWWIGDDVRDGYNQGNRPMLTADQAAAEDNGWGGNAPYDALSNGFKIRRTGGAFNTNANSYLYMAFAVHPFAGTTPATAR
jgi:hypothetical protein